MSDITLSSAVRSNLLSLQNTADLMSKTQERLATGLKVNSALDNPTNFFTASSLNSRANDLARLLDGVSNATQTLEQADNGISAITKLVESAQATARQAQQTSASVETAAQFLGSALANDTNATTTGTVAIGADTQTISSSAPVTGAGVNDVAAQLTGGTNLTGTNDASTVASNGNTLTLNVGGQDVTFEFVDQTSTSPTGAGNVGIALTTDGTTARSINDVASDIQAGIRAATGNSETAAISGNNLVIGADSGDTTNSITVDSSGSTAGVVSALFGSNTSAGPTNSVLSGNNDTLSVAVGTGTAQNINLGTVNSVEDLNSALAGLTGASGSIAADGTITITSDDPTQSLTISGSAAGALGFGSGNTTSALGNASIEALAGQTLTIGDDTLTFGSDDSNGEISTRAELETALGNLTTAGVTASINGSNFLTISADNATTSFSVGGTVDAAAAFGVTEQSYGATSSALSGATGTVTIQIGAEGTEQSLDLSSVNSVEELTTALASITGASYNATEGRVEIAATNTDDTVTIGGDAASLTALGGFTAGTTQSSQEINPKRQEFISQYNEIVGQIDELAEDASFNGVNLLNGDDLNVIFNEDGSSQLDITGVTFDAAGLGLSTLSDTAFNTNTSIEGVLDNLDSAIGSLRAQASEFGSNLSIVETREDFTKATINTLETGAANLTLADTNEEGANLLALQTRQQLSSTALSLASQADQNVLRLF